MDNWRASVDLHHQRACEKRQAKRARIEELTAHLKAQDNKLIQNGAALGKLAAEGTYAEFRDMLITMAGEDCSPLNLELYPSKEVGHVYLNLLLDKIAARTDQDMEPWYQLIREFDFPKGTLDRPGVVALLGAGLVDKNIMVKPPRRAYPHITGKVTEVPLKHHIAMSFWATEVFTLLDLHKIELPDPVIEYGSRKNWNSAKVMEVFKNK